MAEEDALSHHWSPCATAARGAGGVQADHRHAASGECARRTENQGKPTRQPKHEPIWVWGNCRLQQGQELEGVTDSVTGLHVITCVLSVLCVCTALSVCLYSMHLSVCAICQHCVTALTCSVCVQCHSCWFGPCTGTHFQLVTNVCSVPRGCSLVAQSCHHTWLLNSLEPCTQCISYVELLVPCYCGLLQLCSQNAETKCVVLWVSHLQASNTHVMQARSWHTLRTQCDTWFILCVMVSMKWCECCYIGQHQSIG